MAISRRLLNEDERVVVSTHTHVKALLLPAFLLIVLAGVAGYAMTFTAAGGRAQPLLDAVIWLVVAGAALWWVVAPFLRWVTTTYTVTDRRLITRTGVLTRRGHDIPLNRVADVAYEHGVWDRLLGCGTLLVADASEHGRVELPDIPRVEAVHLMISDLLYGDRAPGGYDGELRARRFDDGT